VVAEAFWASRNEEIEPLTIPAPRLADEVYLAVMRVPGIFGIKEYYGLQPQSIDPDLEVLRIRFAGFQGDSSAVLKQIAGRFGRASEKMFSYLSLISDARQLYPWDASWLGRELGRASIDHGWSAATIRGAVANTPDWQSTRRVIFMKTDNLQPHFWMLEDIQLRCRLAAETMAQALKIGDEIIDLLDSAEEKAFFTVVQRDADSFRRVSLSYALHLRETNIAQQLRRNLELKKPPNPRLVAELGTLLDEDVANQHGKGRVLEMRRLFAEDPAAFVSGYLLPCDVSPMEGGTFTLTTR
jgi:hypothetical protein